MQCVLFFYLFRVACLRDLVLPCRSYVGFCVVASVVCGNREAVSVMCGKKSAHPVTEPIHNSSVDHDRVTCPWSQPECVFGGQQECCEQKKSFFSKPGSHQIHPLSEPKYSGGLALGTSSIAITCRTLTIAVSWSSINIALTPCTALDGSVCVCVCVCVCACGRGGTKSNSSLCTPTLQTGDIWLRLVQTWLIFVTCAGYSTLPVPHHNVVQATNRSSTAGRGPTECNADPEQMHCRDAAYLYGEQGR